MATRKPSCLAVLVLAAMAAGATTAAAAAAEGGVPTKPNVVMIVIDDLGYHDLGFRSNQQIRTPALDAMALNGIILDQYYLQPSCSPSRACFQSGRYPLHTGINGWIEATDAIGLQLNETTIADLFKREGYATAAIGKWHLGHYKTQFTPTFRGYDSYLGYYLGSEDYFQHTTNIGFDLHLEPTPQCGPNCSQVLWNARGSYSTNIFGARAVDVIENHDASTPLFMYLAWQGVHAPRQAPVSYWGPYNNTISDMDRRVFAGMLSAVDEGVGNVTEALKAKNMFDNTLFVVTTDNGGPVHECAGIGASNYPFRGGKCSLWEGGTRGTGFVYASWLPKSGFTWNGLMHAVDWLPTIIEGLVRQGQPLPPNATLPLDGVNLWTQMISNGTSPRQDMYYGIADFSVGNHGPAVRLASGWKLVLNGSGGTGDWPPLPHAVRKWTDSEGCPFNILYGQCAGGHVIGNHSANGTDSCCLLCEGNADCYAFTYNHDQGACYLKSAITGFKDGESGNCDSAVQPAYELYNAVLDPTEHTNYTAAQPQVVSQLMKRIQAYEATGVPQQQSNPSCPPYKPHQAPQGPWVGPWCD